MMKSMQDLVHDPMAQDLARYLGIATTRTRMKGGGIGIDRIPWTMTKGTMTIREIVVAIMRQGTTIIVMTIMMIVAMQTKVTDRLDTNPQRSHEGRVTIQAMDETRKVEVSVDGIVIIVTRCGTRSEIRSEKLGESTNRAHPNTALHVTLTEIGAARRIDTHDGTAMMTDLEAASIVVAVIVIRPRRAAVIDTMTGRRAMVPVMINLKSLRTRS